MRFGSGRKGNKIKAYALRGMWWSARKDKEVETRHREHLEGHLPSSPPKCGQSSVHMDMALHGKIPLQFSCSWHWSSLLREEPLELTHNEAEEGDEQQEVPVHLDPDVLCGAKLGRAASTGLTANPSTGKLTKTQSAGLQGQAFSSSKSWWLFMPKGSQSHKA